jgi:uncharacterized RDD family membrane protein YckC
MNHPDYLISTPENVDLHLELAGLGNRILAAFVDHLIIALLLLITVAACVGIAVSIDNSHLPTDTKTILYYYLIGICLLVLFVINFGYFIFFEGTWHGQTPGKRICGIRVIEQNGQPAGWSAILIRNLVRIVDELPGVYIGLLPMMFDKNERRLGDFAAGTLVIRERMQQLSSSDLTFNVPADSDDLHFDTGQITPQEYAMLVTFFQRRKILSASERQRLAADMAQHFRIKLGVPEDTSAPELFLEKLFTAYKRRAELEKEY